MAARWYRAALLGACSSCARARLDLCELCNFCATSASGDSPITDRAIGHRSTTRPASTQAGAEFSCAAWPRAVRAALPAHPCAYGMDTAFLSLGTRACSCIARAQEADAAVARPEVAVMRLSHAPLTGVAWAASIVSPDRAARCLNVLCFCPAHRTRTRGTSQILSSE